ncbi:MAG: DUF4870 domain-containing protein [Acidobacteria bacterium]|nr:DUF4870 domain-containing protein [Acidobacteriota bacterium]
MTKFCTQCGATVNETARFCNKCGAQLTPTQPAQPGSTPHVTYQTPQGQPNYGQAPYQPPYQAPYQSPAASADLKPNVAGMLCYPLFFLTGIIFLVITPYNKDRFVRFHAYQSIFFSVALFVLNIILGILSIILPGFLDRLLSNGLGLIAVGGVIWMMIQAYQGNQFKLPIVGDLAETQARKE